MWVGEHCPAPGTGLTLAPSSCPLGSKYLPALLPPGLHAAVPSSPHPLASSCSHGKLSCSVGDCSKAAVAFGPRGPWGPCFRSCGGLGTRTCNCHCARPTPTPRGQDCRGPRQDLEYCLSPDCPGEGRGTGFAQAGWPNPLHWPFVPSCFCPSLAAALGLFSSYFLALCFSSIQVHSTKFLELLPRAP